MNGTWPRKPLTPDVTADLQTTAICTYIDLHFAFNRGGNVIAMESMWHVWEYILTATDEPTVLVCCTGETPRGSFAEQDQLCRVDRQWTVVLIRGHGFTSLLPGPNGTAPGVENMLTSITALRDTVRVITSVSEEIPINYKGWHPLPAVARPGTVNVFVAGAQMEFSTANDIPVVSEDDPGNPSGLEA